MNSGQTATESQSVRDTLELYSSAHKWLVIPVIVILVAFTPQYFATFASEPWAYHMHAWAAIIWYALMVSQPYLATRGRIRDHRKWGMVGLIAAGAFIVSGLIITPTNVYFGLIGGFPPVFPAEFFFGLTLTETLAMLGFAVSVTMAIIKSRVPDQHAIWMLGTVFFGFMPAWLRLSMFPVFAFGIEISTTKALSVSIPVFVAVILYVGYKIRKLTHPMIIASSAVTVLMISTSYVGGIEWYQEFVTSLMKPMVPWPAAD
ncbi:MAG: hypothetical protein QNI99_12925 [Woeseiaceae bacterium]|nr:hypothetical protein [Woeseiaceae bacterium]